MEELEILRDSLFNQLNEEKENVYDFLLELRQKEKFENSSESKASIIQLSLLNVQYLLSELENFDDEISNVIIKTSKEYFAFLVRQILKEF